MTETKLFDYLTDIIQYNWDKEFDMFLKNNKINIEFKTLNDFITYCENENFTEHIIYKIAIMKMILKFKNE